MADICDQADDQQQALLDAAIKRSKDSVVQIDGDGGCLECGAIVEPVILNGKKIIPRWCCVECRDRWDKLG